MLLVDVDDHFLHGLQALARGLIRVVDDAGTRHRQLEAFAAHVLDEHAELKLAAPRDVIGVLVRILGDADRDIALGLFHQAVANDSALDLVTLLAREGTIIDAEGHGQRRRIDRLRGHRRLDRRIAQRVGDRCFSDASNGDDITGLTHINGRTLETAESKHLRHARRLDQLALARECLDGLVRLDGAGENTARQNAAEIGICFERGREQAERPLLRDGRRHVLEDQIEERLQVLLGTGRIGGHPAIAA